MGLTKLEYLNLMDKELTSLKPFVFSGRAAAYLSRNVDEFIDPVKWAMISDLDIYKLEANPDNNCVTSYYGKLDKPVQVIHAIPTLPCLLPVYNTFPKNYYLDQTIEIHQLLKTSLDEINLKTCSSYITFLFDYTIVQKTICFDKYNRFINDRNLEHSKLELFVRQKAWFRLYLSFIIENQNSPELSKLALFLNRTVIRGYKYLTNNCLDITQIDSGTLSLISLFLQRATQSRMISLCHQSSGNTFSEAYEIDLVYKALAGAASGEEYDELYNWIPYKIYEYFVDYNDKYLLV